MDDLFSGLDKTLPGYRLHKLEMSNWGTFDSTQGSVHSVRLDGQPTLLVGQNGSGKSTLVDALLTLLVRPVVRNYNVAAGAQKQERDEKTYLRGAFGRSSRDDDNRAAVEYLRPGRNHHAVLLACFRNEAENSAFTLAIVLYFHLDERIERIYCFANEERSIVADFQKLDRTDRLKQQLAKRGFRTTTNYPEYHGWFAKLCGLRPKAMDIFNQTVAIKDIQKLNDFIRQHMLEGRPWRERIDALLVHFQQLDDAHRSLVRVRRQRDLLEPVARLGAEHDACRHRLQQTEKLLAATDSFFRRRTIDWLTPVCEQRRAEQAALLERLKRLDRELADSAESIRLLKNDIEQAGGQRMRELPHLIRREQDAADTKQEAGARYHNALRTLAITDRAVDAASFGQIRNRLGTLLPEIDKRLDSLKGEYETLVISRADILRALGDDERELAALRERQGNLPEGLTTLRRRLCDELRLNERELPFVAELLAVRPEEARWEASIEMVLRGFALSLLVPERHYGLVSRYVDGNRLVDGANRGQRLVYLRVGVRAELESAGPVAHPQSLFRKLNYREGHSLLPWVKAELETRFDFRCCDTIEEFQAAPDFAVTANRHVKLRDVRHEKDDRERTVDRRNFVLGWDNREKQRYLQGEIARLLRQRDELNAAIDAIEADQAKLREKRDAISCASAFCEFAQIDDASHRAAAKDLKLELESLESADDQRKLLKKKLQHTAEHQATLQKNRDEAVRDEGLVRRDLLDAEKLIRTATDKLQIREADGLLAEHEKQFAAIAIDFPMLPGSIKDLNDEELQCLQRRREEEAKVHEEIDTLVGQITPHMSRFLQEMPDARTDLAANILSLASFLALREQILREDLPRHEERFKERLNEKVTQEIGLLNGELAGEKAEIARKIDLLNRSLRELEYRAGTYMRLEPKPVRDSEVVGFQAALRECLADAFDASFEANEARFERIKKLIDRLRTEDRWREKVTDVRRWFDFVACERDQQTDAERGYYEDSSGQSGGEKAKLAFTILVAAIAYQFDLDPQRRVRPRFHFVVVDEMFSKVDDRHAEYALELFQKFGLQLLIVAPLDAKARVTEPYVGRYLLATKDAEENRSELHTMSAREFEDSVALYEGPPSNGAPKVTKPR